MPASVSAGVLARWSGALRPDAGDRVALPRVRDLDRPLEAQPVSGAVESSQEERELIRSRLEPERDAAHAGQREPSPRQVGDEIGGDPQRGGAVERRDGSEFARTVIPRLRVEYQPTRALFFRTIAQYRAERRAALVDPATGRPLLAGGVPIGAFETNGLRLEWLASYEPTPGTVAFLGYAVDLAERDPLAFDHLRATGDGLFLKVAYQFRR